LTGYAQGAIVPYVTGKTRENGYGVQEVVMDPVFALLASLVLLVSLALASLAWGEDSRPTLPDDHAH
jgi:hypothetical protein